MGQIQKGFTYSNTPPTNQVTYTNLNAHVDDAILLTGAITEQTEVTSTETADQALVYDASAVALKRVTLDNFVPDGAVTAAKLNATLDLSGKTLTLPVNCVDDDTIIDGAVGTAELADGAVTAAKLAADAVTTAKILDANVTNAKIADGTITNAKLATGSGYFAKGIFNSSGVVTSGSNIASVVESSTGHFLVTFTNAYASTSYVVQLAILDASGNGRLLAYNTKGISSFVVEIRTSNGTQTSSFSEVSLIVW